MCSSNLVISAILKSICSLCTWRWSAVRWAFSSASPCFLFSSSFDCPWWSALRRKSSSCSCFSSFSSRACTAASFSAARSRSRTLSPISVEYFRAASRAMRASAANTPCSRTSCSSSRMRQRCASDCFESSRRRSSSRRSAAIVASRSLMVKSRAPISSLCFVASIRASASSSSTRFLSLATSPCSAASSSPPPSTSGTCSATCKASSSSFMRFSSAAIFNS
mmetsp:Transcript_61103/g.145515  ORF Transcript_61103/g.145515 Transcript_61103/m.145515 type:complete len:222 (-) Transcript_61103:838-1503(-)